MDTSCWGNQGRDFGSLARSTRGRLVAVAIVLVALPVAPALADVTAQAPTVIARQTPPEFVAAATAGTSPSLGLVSSSPSLSAATGLIVGDQGRIVMTQRSPGVFSGSRGDIFYRPGTYYWQAVDERCQPAAGTGCSSPPVAFDVTPLPAPAMVAPADDAQIVNGTSPAITIQDVPVYDGARQLSVEFSRSPQLAANGVFAQPFLARLTWILASSVGADGTSTRTLPLGYEAALTHARVYWHVVRNDCFAEPDCVVTDGLRSFTVTPGPDPRYPDLDPEARVVFDIVPRKVPIGYVIGKSKPPRKVKVGDVMVFMTCRALPCHVSTRVTTRLRGRTRLLANRTFDRPAADPARWWEEANHFERVRLSKRLRAEVMSALKRHRRVPITATGTATNLAGHPERHVSRGAFTLSPPSGKTTGR
jgi:hypothetical protein